MRCIYVYLLSLLLSVAGHALYDAAGWPIYSLVRRGDPGLTLCTGTDFGGTCANFTIPTGVCQNIDVPYSTNLWSSRSAEGYICFLFRNTGCTGCEACVNSGGWGNMSTFDNVHSMQCVVPDEFACSDAICSHREDTASPPSTNPAPVSTSTTSTASTPTKTDSKSNTGTIVGGAVGGVVALLILTTIFVFLFRRRRNHEKRDFLREFKMEDYTNHHQSNYGLEPFVSTSPSQAFSPSKGSFGQSPATPYPLSIVGSSGGPPSTMSSPTTQRSELEDRIRYLEERLVSMDTTSRDGKIVLSLANQSPITPIEGATAHDQILNLHSEIEGLRRQQRSLLQQFDAPPAYEREQ